MQDLKNSICLRCILSSAYSDFVMPNDRREKDMDALAERIRLVISQWTVCEINHADLAVIWKNTKKFSYDARREAVLDFATRHHFQVEIDYAMDYAIFR